MGFAAAALAAALVANAATVHTSTSRVYTCEQTQHGLWAGTDGGLVRVGRSGSGIETWTRVNGLPGTRTRALLADGERLWVGTEAGVALATMDGRGLQIRQTLRSKPVRDLVRYRGRLYVATWGGGVLVADGNGLRRLASKESKATRFAIHGATLYVGTAGGLHQVSGRGLKPVPGSPTTAVWSMASHQGALWVGGVAGLSSWDGKRWREVGADDVRSLHVEGGRLIAGSFGGGLKEVRAGRMVGIRSDRRMAFVHRASATCVATEYGLWRRRGKGWARATLSSGPPSNDISALARQGSRLWVGTFDQGLGYYEAGRWHQYRHHNIDPKINALRVDPRGRLWIATAAGLSVINGKRVLRLSFADGLPTRHILTLQVLADGSVLAGTTQGAVLLRDGRRPVLIGRKQGVYIGNVWAVAQDSAGFLWLGTTKGVYRGKVGGSWERLSVVNSKLRDDWVMSIVTEGDALWVGTYKGGVTRFDIAGESVRATQLGDGWVNPGGLTWRGGKLFASTMEGLLVGDGKTAGWERGLKGPGVDTTAVAFASDGMWVATRRGLIHRGN